MKFILSYMKKYKLWILLDMISVFGFVICELGIPTLVSQMIDQGISYSNMNEVYKYGLILVGICIFGVSLSILLGYCSSKIATNITKDIRNDIFKKVQYFSASEMDYFGISSMITRTNNDAFQIQLFVNVLLRTALLTPIMIISSFVMTLRASLELSLIIFTTVPFIIIGVIVVAKLSDPISRHQQAALDGLNLISKENLSGLRVIRSFNQEQYETKRFFKQNDLFTHDSKKLFWIMTMTSPLFFFLMNLAILGIYLVAIGLIEAGSIQVGQLVAFMDYLFHAMFSVMMFCSIFMMYPRAKVSGDRIKEVLDHPISIQDQSCDQCDDQDLTLTFDHVSFAFENGEDATLKDISFSVKKGEMIAFVGSTGSGKSTLIQLIPRLYDVSEGSIYIGNKNIKDYPLKVLRDKIAFIRQKAFLFQGSIKDNLLFAKSDATQEEMNEACHIACAYDFIMSKEHQFDEILSEGASNLSGGQKQRLSIARALLKDSDIYIFDDAFSALDFKTDAKIRKALKAKMKDKIMMVVAQRISTIMDADQIIVLHEGKMVGKGKHQQLLKNCQIYREIAYSQLGKEELQDED